VRSIRHGRLPGALVGLHRGPPRPPACPAAPEPCAAGHVRGHELHFARHGRTRRARPQPAMAALAVARSAAAGSARGRTDVPPITRRRWKKLKKFQHI
jgi:hypothetical protein